MRLPALRAAADIACDGDHDLAPDDTAGTGVAGNSVAQASLAGQ